ncbi:MAG: molecular chaperone DnaK [Bacteroidetes bacterium]|nr:molecular chaperone DnaK [Bacteroidota bacterium]MCY4204570.1 molecular chaperone DnaK [Bacteroidota bacterium]
MAPKKSAQALAENQGASDHVTTPFDDDVLAHFRALILDKRKDAVEDVAKMQAQIKDSRERSESDSAYSFHMADAGTDAMEREKLYLMLARQQKYIGYLDRALERIDNRTYGICKVTGNPISRERLEAVPHTEISIEAKLKQKR